MHMIQHVLLLDVVPILLILGLTKGLLRPVTRRLQTIEQRAGFVATPAFAVAAYAGFMWLWHIPALYDAALNHVDVHALEHICFGVAGGLYWWHLLSPIRARMRLGGMGPVGYMVSTKLLVGLLGIALAFAPNAFYPFYEHHPHYWGLTPGQDQNLAGLVMALEQSIVMGIALVYLFVRMLSRVRARGAAAPSATRSLEELGAARGDRRPRGAVTTHYVGVQYGSALGRAGDRRRVTPG